MTSSDKPLFGTFRVIAGPDQQREFDLDPLSQKKRLSFGRHHSCDYVLGHPTVSREHFALELSGPRLLLVDSLSGNGTFVNGDRVTWVELKSGDKVQAGPFVMIATLVDDSASNAAAEPEESGPSYSSLDPAGAYRLEHELVYPRQYLTGIVEFNQGKYFEAHEVWEEVWLRSEGEAKTFYQALIHAAVALYHLGRGNRKGALALYHRLASKVDGFPGVYMALNLEDVARQVGEAVGSAEVESRGATDHKMPRIKLESES